MAANRRVGLALAGAAVLLAAAGALWFVRSAQHVRRDPGLVYRDRTTLDNLLKRANEAERAGDRATAVATYRFVIAAGAGNAGAGEREGGGEWAPYVAAAQAGLKRLGAADTRSGPPH